MTIDSVPDGRSGVPLLWWVPLVAAVVLAVTTIAVLPVTGNLSWLIGALVVSVAGYALVWSVIRPAPLRLSPRLPQPRSAAAQHIADFPTQPIVLVGLATSDRPAVRGRRLRGASLLLRSSLVLMGMSGVWSLLTGWLVHPAPPVVVTSRTVAGAMLRGVVNALATSILEECGIAVLILAVAGVAGVAGVALRHRPRRWDSSAVAWWAVLSGTLVRTVLHIPLWGWGAIGRIGLSLALAWLFWRTRRIWPLIVAHLVWDSVAIQAVISPSLPVKLACALLITGWVIAGFVIGCVALSHSRASSRRSAAAG